MKKFVCLLFFFSCFLQQVVAQNDTIFINKAGKTTLRKLADYKRVIKSNPERGNSDLVIDYYITGEMFMKAECMVNVKLLSIFNGRCIYYYKNGNKMADGNFILDSQIGIWKYWSVDGVDSMVTMFDSNGNQKVEENTYRRFVPGMVKSGDTSRQFVQSIRSNSDSVYVQVHDQASFSGGMAAMQKFMSKHLVYPILAEARRYSGRVLVYFIVEKDGTISNVITFTRPGLGLEEEAERVVKLFPKWSPAKVEGKPVRQKIILPISFKLPR